MSRVGVVASDTAMASPERHTHARRLGAVAAGALLVMVPALVLDGHVAHGGLSVATPMRGAAPLSATASLPPGELTVFAAASLADVLDDLQSAWLQDAPGVPLTASFDASSVLAAQIAEGADVDVFLSADMTRPTELAEAGLTSGQPVTFARNSLTVVVPRQSQAVTSAFDLATPGIRLVATATGVPIARYAEAAVTQLAALTLDPDAFTRAVEANVVSREDNVRAALAKVELGEADAAIVYATDARASEHVREVPFPDAVAVTAEYGGVQVSDEAAAAAFMAWISGPRGTGVLTEAGFLPPST